ncbi:DUF6279 family lipoprotein [Polaromonas sp.]|uniref:DUF6279 family lipoprotein n=1 Tax=Polaromonas sp. TaxID=1869339 RepID=UPI00272D646E|nr:DUF6279 family lipoprotein [Polaromonas sp.]
MQLSRIKNQIIDGLQPGVRPRVRPLARSWVLVLAVTLLAGCSSVRLAYSNASQLGWWWLDGYFDFSREQAPQVKQALDGLFDWHRATQLPEHAALLARTQAPILEPTTPAQTCRWQAEVREQLEPLLQRALQLAAEQVPGLTEAQLRHLEQRYAKGIDEMRGDFLQDDPGERLTQSVKRAVERAERLYGRLDEAQRRLVRSGVIDSPFDPALWLKERQRRQREVLVTLRRLVAERADADQRLAALRMLLVQTERSPDPVYRAYQLKLGEYNCGFAARIHNATTPAQRLKARETLKGWEDDLRALMAP